MPPLFFSLSRFLGSGLKGAIPSSPSPVGHQGLKLALLGPILALLAIALPDLNLVPKSSNHLSRPQICPPDFKSTLQLSRPQISSSGLKSAYQTSNPPSITSIDILKTSGNSPPVSYRTLAFWGCCPALTPLLNLITWSRALDTTDQVRSLDNLFCLYADVCTER